MTDFYNKDSIMEEQDYFDIEGFIDALHTAEEEMKDYNLIEIYKLDELSYE